MAFTLLTIAYGSVVGLSLGLSGGGGSILAIPLLVYGLQMPLAQAMVMSLLMVSGLSLFGALRQAPSGNVDWRTALLFSLAGIVVAPVVAGLAHYVDDALRLILFAVLMLLVACRMGFGGSRDGKAAPENGLPGRQSVFAIALGGALAGTLAGFFGVGGGFVIVPLLTMLFAMSYRRAVGTSLASIFLISLSALAGAFGKAEGIDWVVFALFAGGGLAGMLLGGALIRHLPEGPAKKIFAVMTAGVALYMIAGKFFMRGG